MALLCDIKRYNEAYEKSSHDYQIISEVLYKISDLNIENEGCHRFGYFREILSFIGFVPNKHRYRVDEDHVLFIVSVIKQILDFEYSE